MSSISKHDYEMAHVRHSGRLAALCFGFGVLEFAAGDVWLGVIGMVLAGFTSTVVVISWDLAKKAEAWDDAPKPKLKHQWYLLGMVVDAALGLGNIPQIVVSAMHRNWADAVAWLLATVLFGELFTWERSSYLRSKPKKVPVRPGPPEEWL